MTGPVVGAGRRRGPGLGTSAVLLVLALLCAYLGYRLAPPDSPGSVSIMGPWVDSGPDDTTGEQHAFQSVLARFEKTYGIHVDYQGTRAVAQVLQSDVQKGSGPDLVVMPSPGLLQQYAAQGELQPLDGLLAGATDGYGKQWLSLEKVGTTQTYGVVVKAGLKSMVWYDPRQLDALGLAVPQTWAQLQALQQKLVDGGRSPWCLGMGDAPSSGWPGTDWIEDILLHRSGPQVYGDWANGLVPWTSDAVRAAWQSWGSLLAGPRSVLGGSDAALLTQDAQAGQHLFTASSRCYLDHEGSFIVSSYGARPKDGSPPPKPQADFDYFPFPVIDPQYSQTTEVSADLVGMFHPTRQAQLLVRFLASHEGQRIWPGISGSGAFSADSGVQDYGDPVSQRIADQLTRRANTLCFDASDLMPSAMSSAFYQAVLEFLDDPTRLDGLLKELEQIRLKVYPSAGPPHATTSACGAG